MSINTPVSSEQNDNIKGRSNTQIAVDFLRSQIIENKLPPGSNHLESELAEMLGMSRTPIREASLVLEANGLVEVKPRHGIRVLPVSVNDMSEIYDILTELESLSAYSAAASGHPPEYLADLKSTINAMDAALENNDLEAWAAADDMFHFELVLLGGNKRIARIFQTYSDQVRRVRKLTLYLRPLPTNSNNDHCRLVKAIERGNCVEARAIHHEHRAQAKKMLIALLEKHGFDSL